MSSPRMLDRDRRSTPAERKESHGPADARRTAGGDPGDEGWAIAALRETIGLMLIRDVRLDSKGNLLCFHDDGGSAARNQRALLLEPADTRRLTALAGPGRASVEVQLPIGGGGSYMLCLQDWQSGLAWRRGLIAALRQPQETIEALRQHSRLADMGMQAAMMAHELRQPLFAITMAAENLRRMLEPQGEPTARPRASAQRIAEQVGRAHEMIEQMLRYAKGGGQANEADAVHAARMAIDAVNACFADARIRIRLSPQLRCAPVLLSALEVEQIFGNVLRNAVDSILARRAEGWSGDGAIEVSLDAVEDRLVCVVADNGKGIEDEARKKAGEPFFTTKGDTGTGLGLYICRQILANAGGWLEIGPGSGEGARVEFAMRLAGKDAIRLPPATGG